MAQHQGDRRGARLITEHEWRLPAEPRALPTAPKTGS